MLIEVDVFLRPGLVQKFGHGAATTKVRRCRFHCLAELADVSLLEEIGELTAVSGGHRCHGIISTRKLESPVCIGGMFTENACWYHTDVMA